jgi:hypothetical protein
MPSSPLFPVSPRKDAAANDLKEEHASHPLLYSAAMDRIQAKRTARETWQENFKVVE